MLHPIFFIPELAVLVLSNLRGHRRDLNALSRTCKTLKDHTLPILWCDLDSVLPLLLLLGLNAPEQAGKPWVFHRRPTPEAWDKFNEYGDLVRSVALSPISRYKNTMVTVCNSAFATIAFSRPPSGPLLPQLQSISIQTSKAQHQMEALVWLSPTLETATLSIETVDPLESGVFLREIPRRCPSLKQLEIAHSLAGIPPALENSLARCISGLPKLERVAFPWGFMQAATFNALGNCKDLRRISTVTTPSAFINPSAFTVNVNTVDGSFSHLTHFCMFTALATATKLVEKREWAESLEVLEVISSDLHLRDTEPLFASIRESRPNLTVIRLDWKTSIADREVLTFDHLLPILEHAPVKRFFLRHQHPFSPTLDQLRQILMSWPDLVELSLCVDPYLPFGAVQPNAGVPLDYLNLFAECRPQIEDVGMYFKALTANASVSHGTLNRLKTLHVGRSPGPDVFSAALFLAELCDPQMNIVHGDRKFPSQGTPAGFAGPKVVLLGRYYTMTTPFLNTFYYLERYEAIVYCTRDRVLIYCVWLMSCPKAVDEGEDLPFPRREPRLTTQKSHSGG